MKSTLPASHLLRHYVLFALTVVFLLTMIRAAYGLWQFPKVMEADALVEIFVTGLRLIAPVIIGSLLGMFDFSRGLAKYIVLTLLILGLLFVLLTELISPWFIQEQGVRPDLPLLMNLENPQEALRSLGSQYLIPTIIGTVLVGLIFIAFWARLETSRMLRYRLSRLPAILLALVGGALCVVAIWSDVDPRNPPLYPGTGLISADATVNDIATNTGYKTLYSIALPYINQIQEAAPGADTGTEAETPAE